jgi:hypothetical protein
VFLPIALGRYPRPKELQEQFADGAFCITIGEPSKPRDTNKVKVRM